MKFWRRLLGATVGLLVVIAVTLAIPRSDADVVAQKKKGRDPGKDAKKDPTPPPDVELPESWVKQLNWRNVGPANMSGRITALAVFEADPTTYWAATASGGLVKTINNGVTFEHQFDREATVSIGDVCVAPSNRDIVWVGGGEANPRNSVSWGDGVYKSTDGGKTWKNMGLKKSFQIGKILIHPTNPDIVYVGALGRLYGPNEERGLFKTTDGGKTWDKIHFVDDKTGVIDMVMHPTNPEVLWIATWERARDGYDSWPGGKEAGVPDGYNLYDPVKKWGPGSGIWKTTDGGKKFTKLTKGLPSNNLGRIGLDVYRKDPNVLFAIIDCEKIGMGTPPRGGVAGAYLGMATTDSADGGVRIGAVVANGPAARAGLRLNDIIVRMNDKEAVDSESFIDWTRDFVAGEKAKLEVRRGEEKIGIEVSFGERPQPKGKGMGEIGVPTATRPFHALYGGQMANIQHRQGNNSHEYGGVYKSTDGGESWTRINSFNPRPMYFSLVRVDPSDDKRIYVGGVQMYQSADGGHRLRPIRGGQIHADQHALWIDPKDGRHMIVGTDGGFYVTYDRMENWDHMNQLALGQFYHVAVCGKKPYWIFGGLQDNGTWGFPSMSLRGPGPLNEDAIPIFGGDGYVCRVDANDPDLVYYEMQNGGIGRYNLRTGERRALKPTDPRFRFNWNTPYILSAHNSSIFYCGANYVLRSVKQGEDLRVISPEITRTKNGSATALAESPLNPEVLWAGTDDGYLWLTRNGGKDWVNLADKLKLPKPYWIATIEASRLKEGMAYVAFDGHRLDDDDPHVYVTEDFGETWKSLRGNLPAGSSRCLREDVVNPNVLYLGTEFAVWASINRGKSWTKLNNNLPTVAVHEIAVHPTAGEIVAGTHGRSAWILDVTALRQMATAAIKDKPMLYKPNDVTRWQAMPGRGRSGRRFVGQNPPPGVQIFYSLAAKANKTTMQVFDIDGRKLADLPVRNEPGLHRTTWLLAADNRPVPVGAYRVVLNVDGVELSQSFKVEGDAGAGRTFAAEEERDDR